MILLSDVLFLKTEFPHKRSLHEANIGRERQTKHAAAAANHPAQPQIHPGEASQPLQQRAEERSSRSPGGQLRSREAKQDLPASRAPVLVSSAEQTGQGRAVQSRDPDSRERKHEGIDDPHGPAFPVDGAFFERDDLQLGQETRSCASEISKRFGSLSEHKLLVILIFFES